MCNNEDIEFIQIREMSQKVCWMNNVICLVIDVLTMMIQTIKRILRWNLPLRWVENLRGSHFGKSHKSEDKIHLHMESFGVK